MRSTAFALAFQREVPRFPAAWIGFMKSNMMATAWSYIKKASGFAYSPTTATTGKIARDSHSGHALGWVQQSDPGCRLQHWRAMVWGRFRKRGPRTAPALRSTARDAPSSNQDFVERHPSPAIKRLDWLQDALWGRSIGTRSRPVDTSLASSTLKAEFQCCARYIPFNFRSGQADLFAWPLESDTSATVRSKA